MSRQKYIRRSSGLNGMFGDTRPMSQYPQTYAGLPPDMDDWTCDQFKLYYQRNKSIMGKTAAIDFITSEASRMSWTSTFSTWCKYDCNFVKYFESEGIPDDTNIFAQLYCAVENTGGVINNVTGGAQNVTGAVRNLTNNPVLAIGLLAGAGYVAYTMFNKK